MLNTLSKYFLFFCIFLLSGYGHLSAHSSENFIPSMGVQESFCAGIIKHSPGLIFKRSTPCKENGLKIEVIEIEEKEERSITSKDFLLKNSCFLSAFYSQMYLDFFSYIKTISPFYKCFTYTPLSWNILFQVFRL